ncbi:retrovirus-related pol polyprotein from transposon TNT 1-94, partial [Tanacetum coccineum]
MDVKTAFLHVKEGTYGLKQAPRAWYDELSTFLLQNHFFKGTIDPTLFIRRFDDDILVAKPTEKHLKEVKRIFCYLWGIVNTGLWYTKDSGRKSLVSWSSKKQDCTALSTAEADMCLYPFDVPKSLDADTTDYQLADLFTKLSGRPIKLFGSSP